MTVCATVRAAGGDGVLDGRPLGVRGQREDEDAAAVSGRQIERRPQRTDAEIGTHSDRVGTQRAGWIEVRVGVRGHRRADVAPLHVEQDKRSGLARLSDS